MKRLWLFILSMSLVISSTGVWAGQPQHLLAMVGNGNMFIEPQESAEDQEYKVLRVQIEAGKVTYDPLYGNGYSEETVMSHLYEGLYRLINGELVPGMAESYTLSDDGLVYTFRLKDAKWSDGQSVTAQDFEYAWKRVIAPENQARFAFKLNAIKNAKAYSKGLVSEEEVGIKALDSKTLQVTLEKPVPYFLKLISSTTFMPVRKDIINQSPDDWSITPGIMVSNGPYELRYNDESRTILSRNNAYWNAGNINIDYLDIIKESNPFAAYSYFKEEGLQVLNSVPAELINASPYVQKDTYVASVYGVLNHQNEILKSKQVRRALTLAIDRSVIIDTVITNGNKPATGIVPPGLKLTSGLDFNQQAGDYGIAVFGDQVDEAQQLLSEAGFTNREGTPVLKMLCTTSPQNKVLNHRIAEMWKENLNIDVVFEYKEWPEFLVALKQGNYDIAFMSWYPDYEDPLTFLEMWHSDSEFNYTRWQDATFDQLIEKSRYVVDNDRNQILLDAEKRLMDQSVIIPIEYRLMPYMIKDKVINADLSPLGVWYFGNADIVK